MPEKGSLPEDPGSLDPPQAAALTPLCLSLFNLEEFGLID